MLCDPHRAQGFLLQPKKDHLDFLVSILLCWVNQVSMKPLAFCLSCAGHSSFVGAVFTFAKLLLFVNRAAIQLLL